MTSKNELEEVVENSLTTVKEISPALLAYYCYGAANVIYHQCIGEQLPGAEEMRHVAIQIGMGIGGGVLMYECVKALYIINKYKLDAPEEN